MRSRVFASDEAAPPTPPWQGQEEKVSCYGAKYPKSSGSIVIPPRGRGGKGGRPRGPEAGPGPEAVQRKLKVPRTGKVHRVGDGESCTEEEAGFRLLWCPRDGTRVAVRTKCNRARSCPRCSKLWCSREGVRAAHRLFRGGLKTGEWLLPRQVVVSFSVPDLKTAELIEWAHRGTRRVLQQMGVRGGLTVVHPWRHDGPLSLGCWYEGPHAHAVVYGNVDEEKRPAGVVVKTVLEGQEKGLPEPLCAMVVGYLTNHAGYVGQGHVLRWFGSLAYNKALRVGRPPEPPVVSEKCPVCGGALESLPWEQAGGSGRRLRTYGAWS